MSSKMFKATRAGLVKGPRGITLLDAGHPILAKAIAAMLNEDWPECKRLNKSIGLFQGEIMEIIQRDDSRHFANSFSW